MDKNIKNILILSFIIVWIIAIIIGFKQGKKKATQYQVTMEDVIPQTDVKEKGSEHKILNPKPILYHGTEELYTPQMYKTKLNSLKDDITIINEKGDEVKPYQSDQLAFNAFQFTIFDYDMKKEDELKKEIKFDLEEKLKEEHYKGIDEKTIGTNPIPQKAKKGKF